MSNLFTIESLLALLLGGLYGSIFGSIPGLTATLAVALFIPFAFFLDPMIALPAIIAISSVAIYAGDVGSAVAKIPGTPASAAYVEELYSLSQKKGPVYGLGISALGSSVGGIFGTLVLMASATGIAVIAKNFSSFEYFWVAILGLTAGIFASGGSPLKASVSLMLGIFFSTVGIDPTLGHPRFDFGNPNLLSGINFIVAMIGLFGFAEVLEYLFTNKSPSQEDAAEKPASYHQFFIEPMRLIFQHKWKVIRASFVGVFVGFLPGAGADIAAWVSGSLEKMQSRPDDDLQKEKVLLAGTSSNNAAVASAWIPALSLGLPGDTVTAIVLGVFMMKGITPGPALFEHQFPLVASLFGTFLIANVFLLPFYGYLTARLAALLIRIPTNLLLSIIGGICLVGAYALQHSFFDVGVMVAMGLFAFILKRGGFPLAQVVLGMVLGPILEHNFMVSAIKSRWDLMSFFERPIAILLMIATLAVIGAGIWLQRRKRTVDGNVG